MQKFISMDELVEYLGNLEKRVELLEAEKANLRVVQPQSQGIDGNRVAREIANALPQTDLLSPGFFKRAFAVWGHFFVANLIIGTVVTIAYLCLMMLLFGSAFGNLIQQSR